MISFQFPLYLLLLLPVALVLLLDKRKRRSEGVGFSDISLLKLASKESRLTKLPYYLNIISILLVVIALAGPVKRRDFEENSASGVDIILAIDVSGSMDALDFSTSKKEQTRLDAVKLVVSDFVTKRPFDRIGIVAFGGRPYLASPLTLDHNWINKRVDILETGMIEGNTAIGTALASSINHLKDIDSKSKIVILLTDGENNAGSIEPIQAAKAAEALGVKVYTIGAGVEGKAPYKSNSFFTKYDYRDVNIDEEMLNEVAVLTGGEYFRARDMESLDSIYTRIDSMETTKRVANITITYKYYFIYPLLISALLYSISSILSYTILRKTC